jgi:TPR repeat protein
MKFDKAIMRWIVGAAGVIAAGSPLAKGHEGPDAARMWEQFLATADADKAYGALDVLGSVGYDIESVDAGKCAQHGADLQAAIAAAPVSMAVRRAAFLCADATSDAVAAEREMAVLSALSQYALKQSGAEPLLGEPIRVMAPADAFALVESLGMESRYEYYAQLRSTRYFPFVVAAWDEDAKRERRFRFDFVDTAYALSRNNPLYGFPMLRNVMAEAFIKGGLKGDLLAAVDYSAVEAAAAERTPEDKVAKLRRSANAGGIQATTTWVMVCGLQPKYAGCADGLVDALLPRAEAKHAASMVLLSFAHFQGLGIKRDPAAAWALLDAADRIAPQEAIIDFISLWTSVRGDAPLPAEVEQRLSVHKQVKAAELVAVQRKASAGKVKLDATELAFLADPAVNQRGQGFAVLVDYYAASGDKRKQQEFTIKAAEAGHTICRARYGEALINGDVEGIPRDMDKGEKLLAAAAHDGNAWSAMYLASRGFMAADFAAAERWLIAPARAGDSKAIMFLANLYEEERPDVNGKADRALEIYNTLATGGAEGAPARRALAAMAMAGRGMAKDPAKARQWLYADAAKGDHESETVLGYLYLKGDFGKVDEAQGRRWMERALAANTEGAFSDYGIWLFHTKNTPKSRAEALAVWARGDAAGYSSATNNYAWALCTTVHDDAYNPARGLELSKRLGNVDRMHPAWLDTVAACDAAAGDFKRAVELQERAATQMAAFETADSSKQEGDKVPGYKKRLALYKEGKPYRQNGLGD